MLVPTIYTHGCTLHRSNIVIENPVEEQVWVENSAINVGIFHCHVWYGMDIYIYIYIYIWSPAPYDPPMCHLYCYLQHKMRIFSISFLSSSYIVITIQYLKALWGRPHRNKIDRLFWGHSMKKPKKPWENEKKKTKKTKKKTIFRNYLEGPPQRIAKYCFFCFFCFFWFSQGFFCFFMEWPQKSLKILFFLFFLVFSRFFWFFHGVTPEDYKNMKTHNFSNIS